MTMVAVRNAADPEQIEKSERKSRRRGELLREDLVFLLSSPQGRRFIYWLTSECGIYSPGKPGSSEDAFFRAGKREVGMSLIQRILEINPDAWMMLLQEEKLLEARNG